MGSAASSKRRYSVPMLKCPKGYDECKFKEICKLFDKLDEDGNLGISSDELDNIAKLHVMNCCTKLTKRMKAEEDFFQMQVAELRAKHQAKVDQFQSQIDWYNGLCEEGREAVFMKVLTPKGDDHVSFWMFFEYMKNRVHDIKNIPDQ